MFETWKTTIAIAIARISPAVSPASDTAWLGVAAHRENLPGPLIGLIVPVSVQSHDTVSVSSQGSPAGG